MTRRDGLRTGAAAALSYSRLLGANDLIRGALIGCGVRGVGAHLPALAGRTGIEMVAACDVYKPNLDRALSHIAAAGGKPQGYTDYRRILERPDIDVVFIATPDHWHAPITVAACSAGKDVYVEKPLANSIEDCFAILDAALKHRSVVQVGVQQRSMEIYARAMEMIKDGKIGAVQRCSMVWDAEGKPESGQDSETNPPDGLDWDMFQGPAPRRTYRPSRQFSWRRYWQYGSGPITDLGVHLLDVTRWFMDLDLPRISFGMGCQAGIELPERVPERIDLAWKYDRFLATFSTRPDEWGNTFWGERGSLLVNRKLLRIRSMPVSGGSHPTAVEIQSPDSRGYAHVWDFLECVRTRRKPKADPEIGCRSTIPCLLAALSVRSGKTYRFDWERRRVLEI